MLYGNDISDKTTVLEADLKWICKFQKGDFLGKAVLEKQLAEGRPAGRSPASRSWTGASPGRTIPVLVGGGQGLRGLLGDVRPVPEEVHRPGLSSDRARPPSGTEIEIGIRDKMAKAKVVPTPFYKREKK